MKTWMINRSYVWAGVIAVVITAWILSGKIGQESAYSAPGNSPRNSVSAKLSKVRVTISKAEPFVSETIIRGQSEASRIVVVRAETVGTIVSVPVEEGAPVAKGDILCELSIDAREAQKLRAEANLTQRKLEYQAAKQLLSKGHRSETQEAASLAALNAAQAALKEIEIEISHTKISAPFDGVVDDRPVEVGDYMSRGDACATVIDQQPFLIVGHVSETEVAQITKGAQGVARLITGETHKGHIRFIAKRADPATRTFRVELEVSNDDLSLRDGLTAQINIPSHAIMAHKLSPSSLVLNDRGQIGVRAVDKNNIVVFHEATILSDDPQGIWASGLPNPLSVITVGQQFVGEGQKVEAEIIAEEAKS